MYTYISYYKKQKNSKPASAVPVIQMVKKCVIAGNVITDYEITRDELNLHYPPAPLSHNHSTAFDVFCKTLSFRLQGETLENALREFIYLFEEMAALPGAAQDDNIGPRCQQIVQEIDNLLALPKQDPEVLKHHLLKLGTEYLELRNTVPLTFLPLCNPPVPAVGHSEASVMQGIYDLFLSGGSDENTIIQKIVNLFDTLAFPRPASDGEYVEQHIASMKSAFACFSSLPNYDRIFDLAKERLAEIVRTPLTPEEEHRIAGYRDTALLRQLRGSSKDPRLTPILGFAERNHISAATLLDLEYLTASPKRQKKVKILGIYPRQEGWLYAVQFSDHHPPKMIPRDLALRYFPLKLLKYLESHLKFVQS